jgi:hypothetical protein
MPLRPPLMVRRRRGQRRNAGTALIALASIGAEHARVTAGWRDGFLQDINLNACTGSRAEGAPGFAAPKAFV